MLALFPILIPHWLFVLGSYAVKTAIVAGISYGVGRLLAPKPKNTKPGVEPVTAPTCESRPYPVVLGTPPFLRGPNYLAWWNVGRAPVRHNSTTVGTYYSALVHMGLCQRGIDGIRAINCNGLRAWPVLKDDDTLSATGVTTITLDGAQLFGGPLANGGITSGPLTVEDGSDTQVAHSYLTAEYGADIPANRGFVGVVGGLGWVNSGQIPSLAFLVTALAKMPDGSDIWYASKAAIGLDLNPAHMIYKVLTMDLADGGAGLTATDLDDDSFRAAADTLYSEGIGISATFIPEADALDELIEQIELIIQGHVRRNHATGRLELKLVRDDFELDEIPAFDEDDFEVVEFTRPGIYDVPARSLVEWSNRLHPDHAPDPARYEDIGLLAAQANRAVENSRSLPLICDADVANLVVARDGRAMASMMANLTLRCKRTMIALRQGDVCRISYNVTGRAITQMVIRVNSVDLGSLREPMVTIEATEDVFAQAYTIMGSPPATIWTEPTPTDGVVVADNMTMSEAVQASVNLGGSGAESLSLTDSAAATIS